MTSALLKCGGFFVAVSNFMGFVPDAAIVGGLTGAVAFVLCFNHRLGVLRPSLQDKFLPVAALSSLAARRSANQTHRILPRPQPRVAHAPSLIALVP